MDMLDLEENVVFFQVFSDSCIFSGGDESSLSRALQHLHSVRAAALDLLEPITRSYIWQHEPFNLKVAAKTPQSLKRALDREEEVVSRSFGIESASPHFSSSDHSMPHIYGKIKYGDNVEDEWFVVYLLLELSRHFPGLSIRIWDSDGEFLLIEAAYAIPRWLKPENSRNRVFIRHGSLHVLPMPLSPADIYRLPIKPSLQTSLQLIGEGVIETRAGQKVEAAIQKRLSGYPERARKNMHRARCRVPVPVAQILKMEPQLVSLAVEAFYNRDLDSMKAVARMKKFLPENSDGQVEMVSVLVSMSKAMYAQLVQQTFQAPRCYPMPPFSPQYKDAELGMKLTCGFEMMYMERSRYQHSEDEDLQNCQAEYLGSSTGNNGDHSTGTGQGEQSEGPGFLGAANSTNMLSLQKDAGWEAFYKSLESRGYFRGLLEGSQEHKKLMQSAIARYKHTNLFSRVSAAMHAPVKRINEILSLPHSVANFQDVDLQEIDEDSWLSTGEEDLEAAIRERQKEIDAYEEERIKLRQLKKSLKAGGSSNGGDMNKKDYDPEELVNSMKAFLERISSFEGAEIPGTNKKFSIGDEDSSKKLMKELKGAVVLQEHNLHSEEADSTDFTMESDYSDSGESDLEGEALDSLYTKSGHGSGTSREPEGTLEGDLETFPDGNTVDVFMEEYSDVLQQELKSTSLAKTFARADSDPSTSSGPKDDQDVGPIDVKYNLVKNILESYASQHGMPGPASNLLGVMELQLPDDLREHHDKFQS